MLPMMCSQPPCRNMWVNSGTKVRFQPVGANADDPSSGPLTLDLSRYGGTGSFTVDLETDEVEPWDGDVSTPPAPSLNLPRVVAAATAWLIFLTPNVLIQSLSTNDELIAAAPLVAAVGIFGCLYLFISLPNRTQTFFLAAQAIGASYQQQPLGGLELGCAARRGELEDGVDRQELQAVELVEPFGA